MTRYGGWVAAGRIPGVMYVVGPEQTRERISRIAGEHELNVRVELREAIIKEALKAGRAARAA